VAGSGRLAEVQVFIDSAEISELFESGLVRHNWIGIPYNSWQDYSIGATPLS
jgi:hypothetical protein